MSEYIWHHKLYQSGPDTRWATVIVLAWHEGTATVLPVEGAGLIEAIGQAPYLVKSHQLRMGPPPEPTAVPA